MRKHKVFNVLFHFKKMKCYGTDFFCSLLPMRMEHSTLLHSSNIYGPDAWWTKWRFERIKGTKRCNHFIAIQFCRYILTVPFFRYFFVSFFPFAGFVNGTTFYARLYSSAEITLVHRINAEEKNVFQYSLSRFLEPEKLKSSNFSPNKHCQMFFLPFLCVCVGP